MCSVAIPATVFPSCLCGLAALVSRKVFWLVMGSGGFQTQKEVVMGVEPSQVRAERFLAEAITIDSRKEWTYKFCSESQQRESGLQARRARVLRKREKLEAWKPRVKSLEHELLLWEE